MSGMKLNVCKHMHMSLHINGVHIGSLYYVEVTEAFINDEDGYFDVLRFEQHDENGNTLGAVMCIPIDDGSYIVREHSIIGPVIEITK